MRSHYDARVRTTVDLPDDLHQRAKAFARDRGLTFSASIALLLRRGFGESASGSDVQVVDDPATGLPTVRFGGTVTSDDVRALDDEP
jgi:hypothetical protein